MLGVAGAFTGLSLLSPVGSLTRPWADKAAGLLGSATVPACVLGAVLGILALAGPPARSLRTLTTIGFSGGCLAAVLALVAILQSTGSGRLRLSALSPGSAGIAVAHWLTEQLGPLGAVLVLVPLFVGCVAVAAGGTPRRWGLALVWCLWTVARLCARAILAAVATVRGLGIAARETWRAIVRLLRLSAPYARRAAAALDSLARRGAVWWRTRHLLRGAGQGPALGDPLSAGTEGKGLLGRLMRRRRRAEAAQPAVPSELEEWDPPRQVPAAGGRVWRLPETRLFSSVTAAEISQQELDEKARIIEETLASFNVPVTVTERRPGPTLTQFGLRPADGVPVRKIKLYEADLQLALAAPTLRIELPVPGRPFAGIEIPNSGIALVGIREILESPQFREHRGRLRIAVGRDVDGRPRVGDLVKMPHLLIAGQTGSGKSYCINAIIASLVSQNTPDELHLLLIDPKMVELMEYDGLPHLRYPVVIDLAEASKVLLWAVEEMERRYRLLKESGYRNVDSYNRSLGPGGDLRPIPHLVIIIDELADLMMFAPDDVEAAICRLTAKARAAGIHLVMATQRPSVDVVTGLIKANMPARIAFATPSRTDSQVILDMTGAETLLGRGDMLFLPPDLGKPIRVQGTYVSDREIFALVDCWKRQGSPQYVEREEIEALQLKQEAENVDRDALLLDRATALLRGLRDHDLASINFLQRKLGVGYPRAARLMDELEERGVVVADEHGRYRMLASAVDGLDAGDGE